MIVKAVLVGSDAEARSLVAHVQSGRFAPSQSVIVGLEPNVRATLKRAGVTCVDTLAFFDNASHARAVRATQGLRERIRAEFDLDLGDGIDAVYEHQVATIALYAYRHCISTIEILHGIANAYPQCTTIVTCDRLGSHFLQRLCRAYCAEHGLALEVLPASEAEDTFRPISNAGPKDVPGWAAGFITHCYAAIAWALGRRRSVIAYSGGKMSSMIRSLIEQYPQGGTIYLRYFSYSRGQELARAIFWLVSILWGGRLGKTYLSVPIHTIGSWMGRKNRARTGDWIRASLDASYEHNGYLFRYRSIDCQDAVRASAGHAQSRLHQFHDLSLGMAHLLHRLQPSLVISASGGQEHQILGELSKAMCIQSLFISMKSLSDPYDELEQMGAQDVGEVVLTDSYPIAVAQSQQAAAYMQRAGYAGRILCAGPLIRTRLDAAHRDARRAQFLRDRGQIERIIVYAPSIKTSEAFYALQTMDEVVASMGDLVQAVETLSGTCLILRLHPGATYLAQDLPYLLEMGPHTMIDTGTYDSIEGVLSVADLVVSNMSTVAEEAVCNGIPVLLYDRWARYNHLRAPVVDGPHPESLSPVYYLPDQAQLGSTISWLIENHPVGTPFAEAVTDKYIFSDGRSQEFYAFVGQALGASPRHGARHPLADAE